MLRQHFLAFDDYLESDGVTNYSSDRFCAALSSCDHLALFLVATTSDAAEAGTVNVYLEHSADGIDFTRKWLVPLVSVSFEESDMTQCAIGWDNGFLPTLNFVRLAIEMESARAPERMQVRVYAALRDLDEVLDADPDLEARNQDAVLAAIRDPRRAESDFLDAGGSLANIPVLHSAARTTEAKR